MRAKQFNVNLLSITNCSLSNSISLCQQSNAYPSDDNCDQADLYIDQLVDIIQIGCNVKRRLRAGLIRQCQCLNESIFGKADDMIKIDSDPIKIDGVIGRNTEMDGLDYQLATLERQLESSLEQVQAVLADQQMQIRQHKDAVARLQKLNEELHQKIEVTVIEGSARNVAT